MAEPRKRKSAADRRAEIVETAIRLSAEIGPNRVTTQHLANEVGVTQPAIFRHFATKGDIWLAVGDHIVAAMNGLPADWGAPGETADPHDSLQKVAGAYFARITEQPAIPAILYSRELQAGNDTLREKLARVFDRYRNAFAGLIRSGQASGIHRADLAADDAARLLAEAVQGVAMRWLLDGCEDDLADSGSRVLAPLFDSFRA